MALSIFTDPKDGYTLDGRVEAMPGLHPEVRFKYRPCPPGLSFEHARNGGDEASAAKIMAKQATDFVTIEDGEESAPVRISADQFRKLHANIWRGVWNHVAGFNAPYIANGEAEKN